MRTQIRGIHRLKPSGAYSAVFSFVHGYRKPSHSRDALVPAWIRCVHDVGSRTRPRTASARTPSRPSRDARSSSSTATGSRARSGRRRWSMCSATGGGLASVTPPPERSYTARTCRSRSGRRSTSGGGRGDAKGGVVMSRCRQGSRCTGLVCCEPAGPAAPASTRGKILFPERYHRAATLRLCTCVPGQRHQDHPRLSPHCSASLWGVLWECASMVVLIAASIVEYSLGTLSMLWESRPRSTVLWPERPRRTAHGWKFRFARLPWIPKYFLFSIIKPRITKRT